MTGLREVRRELQTIRASARNAAAVGLVVVEAADGFPQASLDAFLDREFGREREHCLVIQLVRFSGALPPRIVADQPTGGR